MYYVQPCISSFNPLCHSIDSSKSMSSSSPKPLISPPFSYFDSEQDATHFGTVHKVFSANNVSKLLLRIPPHKHLDVVVSIYNEVLACICDHIYYWTKEEEKSKDRGRVLVEAVLAKYGDVSRGCENPLTKGVWLRHREHKSSQRHSTVPAVEAPESCREGAAQDTEVHITQLLNFSACLEMPLEATIVCWESKLPGKAHLHIDDLHLLGHSRTCARKLVSNILVPLASRGNRVMYLKIVNSHIEVIVLCMNGTQLNHGFIINIPKTTFKLKTKFKMLVRLISSFSNFSHSSELLAR
ncbi:hypothetical protein Sjap_026295 [Stephania japonica]|uniref:LOB domain-containing protein n=1 Tax=Stephania japonica TaxID=461633 RepID=A0AAP0EB65_9MAGN